tara:strand:+ start:62150 stop:62668 length:519 start_codon:yes stop_codon:yes gene_type:complete
MKKKYLQERVDSYKDFPKKGIIFRDLSPIFSDPNLLAELIKEMSNIQFCKNADAIIAVDARGFLFGSMISMYLSKPMVLARKPGKLPGELISKEYSLEYGTNSLSLQKKAIQQYNSFAIVDDIIATGGTVQCLYELILSQNKEVTGLNVVLELAELKGRDKFPFPVSSQLIY